MSALSSISTVLSRNLPSSTESTAPAMMSYPAITLPRISITVGQGAGMLLKRSAAANIRQETMSLMTRAMSKSQLPGPPSVPSGHAGRPPVSLSRISLKFIGPLLCK